MNDIRGQLVCSLAMMRRAAPCTLAVLSLSACARASHPVVASGAAGGAPETTPLERVYAETPSLSTATLGNFATGMALADINGDGWLDMVTSNGNDVSPQPMNVYLNRRSTTTPFADKQYPSWYSADIAFRGGIAVGDVNGDGWLDVAVAIPTDLQCNPKKGGVALYMNRGGTLEDSPSWRTEDGYGATAVTLADVDADGRLDLAVAVYTENEAPSGCPPSERTAGGHQRIYRNLDGTLERSPSWKSERLLPAAAVLAADIDQDGWMELSFSGDTTQVFYGGKAQNTLPGRVPGWTSGKKIVASYGIDAGWLGAQAVGPLSLVVTSNCLAANPCNSELLFYDPGQGTAPIQSVPVPENASQLALGDLNGDGVLDLVASQMGVTFSGAPLLFLQGPLLESRSPFFTEPHTVGQGLALGDTRQRALREATRAFSGSAPRAVFTLPERRIQAILGVERVRGDGAREAARFAWAPGMNWISLSSPLRPGERLVVRYSLSPVLDVAAAVSTVSTPNCGNFLFYSKYRTKSGM
ncbi:VCBS repeat-containing protein [Sorangium sp. So ce1036]|uniref:FG-GAP repeat domain-containing protein n=1 Tax=Sorangium sp. So ce1036 TaxID=3133328 RepID=UPI003F0ACC49